MFDPYALTGFIPVRRIDDLPETMKGAGKEPVAIWRRPRNGRGQVHMAMLFANGHVIVRYRSCADGNLHYLASKDGSITVESFDPVADSIGLEYEFLTEEPSGKHAYRDPSERRTPSQIPMTQALATFFQMEGRGRNGLEGRKKKTLPGWRLERAGINVGRGKYGPYSNWARRELAFARMRESRRREG